MMTTTMHSEQFLRKRKFLLVLPLLVLPFLTLLFWVLGGKGSTTPAQATTHLTGLNMELPAANLKDDAGWTKMDYYKQADQDSAKRLEQIKRDPYYNLPVMETSVADTNPLLMIRDRPVSYQPNAAKSIFSGGTPEDAREELVQQKLRELDEQLKAHSTTPFSTSSSASSGAGDGPKPRKRPGRTAMAERMEEATQASPEIQQMQRMMDDMESSASEPDPEIKALSGMIDKLTDLQFPERAREKRNAESEKTKRNIFAVLAPETDNISVLESSSPIAALSVPASRQEDGHVSVPISSSYAFPNSDSLLPLSATTIAPNDFYGLEDTRPAAEAMNNTIPAVIHETQTLVNGSTVKLSVLQDISVNGVAVPSGSFLYGQAQLMGERLQITITSLRSGNSILPVLLSVYDLDGQPGLFIPGAITREVTKQSADRSVQQLGLNAIDPSIEMQAASAGIELGKNLLSKKIKLIRVTVKAGYQVLLKDNQTISSTNQ